MSIKNIENKELINRILQEIDDFKNSKLESIYF